jgi:hypothetical protein
MLNTRAFSLSYNVVGSKNCSHLCDKKIEKNLIVDGKM